MKNLNNNLMSFNRYSKQSPLSYAHQTSVVSVVSGTLRVPTMCYLVSAFLLAFVVVFSLQISVSLAASKNSSKLMALGITNKTTSQPSLKEMIGQMLMLGFKGVSPNPTVNVNSASLNP